MKDQRIAWRKEQTEGEIDRQSKNEDSWPYSAVGAEAVGRCCNYELKNERR